MAEKYYSILTNRGKELEAQSSATGKPVIIKDFVVGDGNGQPVRPDPAQTKLVREVYRNAISALQVSPDQANQFVAQLVLSPGVGGFVVREVGLLTDAGELYSVANCAAIEKPENGISVNLQYRLAVSESSSIELNVATGDGLFLRQDANLSDVKDPVLSRKSLGLKGAAVLDVGKSANTVAAGDDSRIVGALQSGKNLSDLQDKAQARTSLELKNAAMRDVTISRYDVTGGNVLQVGDYGLGTINGLATLASIFDIACTAKYAALGVGAGSNATEGMPANSGNTRFSVDVDSIYANQFWVTLRSSNQAYIGQVNTSTKTATWSQIYSTAFKPTAADVGAIPLSGSTAVSGVVRNSAEFQTTSQNSYRTVSGNYGAFWRNDGTAFHLMFTNANDQYGGYGSLRPLSINMASGYPTMSRLNLTDWTYFDARYQAKGDYTPAGQAYTKAESDARFVNWNHGAVGSIVFARLNPQSTTIAPGGTTAGSNIQPASVAGYPDTAGGNWAALRATGSLAGTWRCLGYAYNDMDGSNRHYSATLFVRIA